MKIDQILQTFDDHSVAVAVTAVSAVLLVVIVQAMIIRTVRALRRVVKARRAARGEKTKVSASNTDSGGAPVWTMVGAGISTIVSGEGMWETFDSMHLPIPLRIATFAFLEVMVIQSAIRARASMRRSFSPGIDGVAMWVLTCVSSLLSASHAATVDDPNLVTVLIRFVAPLAAAWGWERSMALERRFRTGEKSKINWRWTSERLLVQLGLADPAERDVSEVAAHRRLMNLALAARRARTTRDGLWGWRRKRALRRVDKAAEGAVEHGGLGTDPESQDVLMTQLGVLYNTSALLEIEPRAPWTPDPTPTLRIVDMSTVTLTPPRHPAIATRATFDPATPAVDSPRVSGSAPAIESDPTSKGDPGSHDDDPDPDPGSPDGAPADRDTERPRPIGTLVMDGQRLAGMRSDAARVRAALDDLGLDATPTEVRDWLTARDTDVSIDAIKSAVRRARKQHKDNQATATSVIKLAGSQ